MRRWLSGWHGPAAATIAALLVVALVGGAVLAVHHLQIPTPRRVAARAGATPLPSAKPTITATPSAPAPAAAGTPARLVIASIGLNATIEQVGETSSGAMGTPQQTQDVAWYAPGVVPGQPGDAVIDGHLDWYTGPAVFQNLASVKPGDVIQVVFSNGGSLQFQVTSSTSYSVQTEPAYLFQTTGSPELSLITCAGPWDGSEYTQRLVVDATPLG